jgi:hypothetical protein
MRRFIVVTSTPATVLSMHRITKFGASVAALAALAAGGATFANATGNPSGEPAEKGDEPDQVITGTAAEKAKAAALKATGGGQVLEAEKSDENGSSYEIKVKNASQITEVQVDSSYNVTSQKADDDQAEHEDNGDGDGETNDDAAGHQDTGDGDGETNDDGATAGQ